MSAAVVQSCNVSNLVSPFDFLNIYHTFVFAHVTRESGTIVSNRDSAIPKQLEA